MPVALTVITMVGVVPLEVIAEQLLEMDAGKAETLGWVKIHQLYVSDPTGVLLALPSSVMLAVTNAALTLPEVPVPFCRVLVGMLKFDPDAANERTYDALVLARLAVGAELLMVSELVALLEPMLDAVNVTE